VLCALVFSTFISFAFKSLWAGLASILAILLLLGYRYRHFRP
jgi:hypothetical protein